MYKIYIKFVYKILIDTSPKMRGWQISHYVNAQYHYHNLHANKVLPLHTCRTACHLKD